MTITFTNQPIATSGDDSYANRIIRFHSAHGRWPILTSDEAEERALAEALRVLAGRSHSTTWLRRLTRLGTAPTHSSFLAVEYDVPDVIADRGGRAQLHSA